jgi:tRNA splicing ligase
MACSACARKAAMKNNQIAQRSLKLPKSCFSREKLEELLQDAISKGDSAGVAILTQALNFYHRSCNKYTNDIKKYIQRTENP